LFGRHLTTRQEWKADQIAPQIDGAYAATSEEGKVRALRREGYASSSCGSGARGTEPHREVSTTLIRISASINNQYSVHEKVKASTVASFRSRRQ
jgi:hypothetical protein